jgi:hypothetical protein
MKKMWDLAPPHRKDYPSGGKKMLARFGRQLRMLLSEFQKTRWGLPA